MIVADNVYYRLYLESLQAIQRVASDEMAQAGFQSLKYMNSDVVLDGGYGNLANANANASSTGVMYFCNTNYLFFRPHRDRNFAPIGDERIGGQHARATCIGYNS